MQAIDPTAQYYIAAAAQTSRFLTIGTANTVVLTTSTAASGALLFSITTSTHNSARRNVCTNYQSSTYCLDQWGNNVTQAALQTPGWFSGQEWSLAATPQSDGTTFWRMQSDFAGSTRYLATDGDGVFMLANAPDSATYWRFVNSLSSQTSASSTTTSTTSTISPTSQSTTATVSSSTTTSSVGSANELRSSPLSTGAIVGIALGGVAVALLAAFVMMFWMAQRRKTRTQKPPNSSFSPRHLQEKSALPDRSKMNTRSQVAEVPAYSQIPRASLHEMGDPRYMPELEGSRR